MPPQLSQPFIYGPTSTDAELLAPFQAEDGSPSASESVRFRAFSALVEKYQKRLYAHVHRLVGTHQDTDDVLQEVFVAVWRNLPKFRAEAALYTWLYRIASHAAFAHLQKAKKHNHQMLGSYGDNFEGADGGMSFASGEPAAPAGMELVDAQKAERLLLEALEALPPKQRSVFAMRYYDELPYEDMASITGTSVGALKASYHLAVRKVEEYVRGKAGE